MEHEWVRKCSDTMGTRRSNRASPSHAECGSLAQRTGSSRSWKIWFTHWADLLLLFFFCKFGINMIHSMLPLTGEWLNISSSSVGYCLFANRRKELSVLLNLPEIVFVFYIQEETFHGWIEAEFGIYDNNSTSPWHILCIACLLCNGLPVSAPKFKRTTFTEGSPQCNCV